MRLDELKQRPGVHLALTRLLRLPKSTPHPQALRRARGSGLISGHGSQCHISERWIERALQRAALFGERPSVECLYGLGELLAHSYGERHPHVRYLARLTPRALRKWLSAASKLVKSQIKSSVVKSIGAKTILSEKEVSVSVHAQAGAFLLRGPSHPLFGLSVIVESLVRSHPKEMVRWLTQEDQAPAVAESVLGYFCDRLLFLKGWDPLHARLLRTGNPFLQMLTGVALCGSEAAPRLSFTAMYDRAITAGVQTPRAFMVALTAIDYAMRESPLSAAQTHSLITEMAARWPAASFNDSQWLALQQALHPQWLELGVELALRLPRQQDSHAVLDRILVTVAQRFGYKNPTESLEQRPDVTPENLENHLKWASRAFTLRYRADSKGVGKQAGQQLHHLCEPARELICQPYAAARFPRIHDVLERYAGVLLLALRIARGDSAAERKERRILMKGSLAEAPALLYITTDAPDANRLLEELARACVAEMADCIEIDERARWFGDPRLPSFARAIALWSDPVAIRQHNALALVLLEAALRPGPARLQKTLIRRVHLVVDFALAALFDAGAKDLIAQLMSQWQQRMALWRGLEARPQRRLPHRIYLALCGPGTHRQWLKNHPEWSHSRCAARV